MDSQGTATRQKLNRKKEESKDSSFLCEEDCPGSWCNSHFSYRARKINGSVVG